MSSHTTYTALYSAHPEMLCVLVGGLSMWDVPITLRKETFAQSVTPMPAVTVGYVLSDAFP